MDPPNTSHVPTLSRALFASRYVLSTLEVAATFLALLIVFGLGERFTTVIAASLAPLLVLILSQYLMEHRRHIRPIEQLAARGLAGQLSADERLLLAEKLVSFPRRVVFRRFLAWAATAAMLIVATSIQNDISSSDFWAILGVCFTVALVFLMWRAQWFRRAAERALLPALPRADRSRYLGRTIRERLFIAAYLPAAVSVGLACLYDWTFLDLPQDNVPDVFAAVPPLGLFLTITFARSLFRWTAPLRGHLAARPLSGPDDGPWKLTRDQADPGPLEALKIATSLPYRATRWALTLWAICSAFIAVNRAVSYGPWQEGFLLFAGLMAVGIAAAFVQLVWSRYVVQPARELCGAELGTIPFDELWPKVRVRDRFIAAILAVLFGSSTFAYTTHYLQQRALVSAAAGAEARALLDQRVPEATNLTEGGDATARLVRWAAHTPGRLIVVVDGRPAWMSPEIPQPASFLRQLESGGQEISLRATRQTVALQRLTSHVSIGLSRPWRRFDGAFGALGLTLLFAALIVVALAIALVAANDFTMPVQALRTFARRLGRGELDAPLPVPDADELGELSLTLDKMRVDLRSQIEAVRDLNQSLERKVAERTAELQRALTELGTAQAQMVHAEKMASVGRLAAGVAHEVNNPLNFIANAIGPLEEMLKDVRAVELLEMAGDHASATREREQRGLKDSLEELDDLLRVLRNGAQRTQQIVRGLRDFSRRDEGEPLKDTDIAALCDQTIALLRHELSGRVEVVRDYAPDSRAACFPGALGQLLMNLLANAAHAIRASGTVTVRTRQVAGGLEIVVRDTGAGIAPDVLPKIFDPFFTTKEVGRGTGLGLSIAHGIVERHGGRISAESTLGVGTAFTVWLPRGREAQARAS